MEGYLVNTLDLAPVVGVIVLPDNARAVEREGLALALAAGGITIGRSCCSGYVLCVGCFARMSR